MQRFRRHLSYANVVATLALVVGMAGGAYAIDQLGTRDVRNNSLRSADLKNRKAVAGRDVRPNSLGPREVREAQLMTRAWFSTAGANEPTCDPASAEATVCAEATIGLGQPMQIQAIAAGAIFSNGSAPASATCTIQLDGSDEIVQLNPGETTAATSATATDGFSGTYTSSEPLPRGRHSVALTCTQSGSADAVIEDPSIAVIAVAAR